MSKKMIYRLVLLNGPLKGEQITVEPDPMLIGREEACTVTLPDEEVAFRHARIEQRGDELFISDLGSMNKIIVNKREQTNTRLKHGDIIELGRTRLLVQAIVQAEVQMGPGEADVRSRRALKRKLAMAASVLLVAGATFAVIQSGNRNMPSTETTPMIQHDTGIVSEPALVSPVQGLPTAPTAEKAPVALDSQLSEIREELSSIQSYLEQLNAADKPDEKKPSPASGNTMAQINEIEVAMKAARDAISAGSHDEAAIVLEHIQREYPYYLPAFVLRAELYEKQGELSKARDQWSFVLQHTNEPDLYRKALAERIRLGREESKKSPGIRDAISIIDLQQIRFKESTDYDDMRAVKIKLSYDRNVGPIKPEGVRLVIYFFEQDIDTKEVKLSAVKPYAAVDLDQLVHESGGVFSGTVNYVVPKGYHRRDHHTSRQRYFGCMARLHYFDELIDAKARPANLLDPAVLKSVQLDSATGSAPL